MSAVEDMLEKATALGFVEGYAEVRPEATAEDIALVCIKLGKFSFENIAKICHMTLEQVQNLAVNVNP